MKDLEINGTEQKIKTLELNREQTKKINFIWTYRWWEGERVK